MQGQAASLGQAIVGFGLSSIPGVFTFAVYLVLIPLMVFLEGPQRANRVGAQLFAKRAFCA